MQTTFLSHHLKYTEEDQDLRWLLYDDQSQQCLLPAAHFQYKQTSDLTISAYLSTLKCIKDYVVDYARTEVELASSYVQNGKSSSSSEHWFGRD